MKRKISKKSANLRALKRELDILWQEIVLAHADGSCELCGEPAYCGHHIFTKGSSQATRWNTQNGIAICVKCHYAAHSSNLCTETLAAIIDVIGASRFAEIRKAHRETKRWRKADYEEIKERLQVELQKVP